MNVDELKEFYQEKVNEIPEIRQLMPYQEEIALDIIDKLERDHKPDEPYGHLLAESMKHLKGKANPKQIDQINQEWIECKK